MSYVCGGSFQVLRDMMIKGDQGVPRPKLGDSPLHPQEIFKKTQASKHGDALVASPPSSTTIRFSPSGIFLLLHILCAELGASILGF